MKTNTSFQHLQSRIAELIQQHIEASRMAAVEAIERAFAVSYGVPIKTIPKTSRNASPCRTPEQIASLAEQFYRAVCDKPGETMTVLASGLGLRSNELTQPVMQLKRALKIRCVGQRHLTRYFPLINEQKTPTA